MNSFLQKLRLLSSWSDVHYCVIIYVFSLILYTLTLRGVYGNPPPNSIKDILGQATKPFELSPERDRFILTYSLAENKSFALSTLLGEAAFPDDGYSKSGRIYIFFAPGISLLALPFYILGHMFQLAQVGAYFSIPLVASGTLVFLFKIARNIFKMPTWAALFAPLVFGFGSSSWNYAITMYQHHVTAFFIISSFYAVWKFKQQAKRSWIWGIVVWTNYALAIGIDYPNAMLLFPVMVYFLISSIKFTFKLSSITFSVRKAFLLTMIPFIMLMGLHGYYNQVNFGSWKTLSGSLADYRAVKEMHLQTKKNGQKELDNIQNAKQPVSFFREENVTNGINILLFSDQRGLFFYSPIFLLAILGILSQLRKKTVEIGVLLGVIAVNLFVYSSFGDPWGGWAFGPRYLIPSMSILSLFVALWLTQYGKSVYRRLTAFGLFIYSAAIALLGALTTNALPPKGEADLLKIPHTYEWNFHFLQNGASSSFLYNTFFASHISLIGFYLILYEILLGLAVVILFILPLKKSYENNA
ncbi:MAG TPA: hypothetical protein VLG12_05490 [Candidatus Saccharimonadales bacterium]|nr:hypothetical protein [Candidatus Saccharimonadales bacterium]